MEKKVLVIKTGVGCSGSYYYFETFAKVSFHQSNAIVVQALLAKHAQVTAARNAVISLLITAKQFEVFINGIFMELSQVLRFRFGR
ncbi:MAG: hypothetical protein LV471_04020 [Nitrosomonas sp.]|nr:hypothetical protein [Nitrosomonas sp.]